MDDMTPVLHNITDGGARIILVAATGQSLTNFMIQAATLGYLSDAYVWLLMGNSGEMLLSGVESYNQNHTAKIDFNSTYTGLFMFDTWLSLYDYPPFEAFLDEWSALDPKTYPFAGSRKISTNEGLAYSCMMVMADGFRQAVSNYTNHTNALNQLALGELGHSLTPPAFNTGYVGPEGPMVFDSNGDLMDG
ncbi:hypothetical protein DFQ30_007244 [Apophysomyces sp. BC1015]|nr:hypothetical protein DFQ30_007244 [Apophysomyces sp. BC1015]